MHAEFLRSGVRPADFPPDIGAEFAVVGRSNSGKSSAINAIFGSSKLARVSKTPGRTQLINFFAINEAQRCVDLPGYGFARVSVAMRESWRNMMTAYFESRTSLRGLLLTIDIRRGIGELDARMLDWCIELDLPAWILATKADKLSRNRSLQAARKMAADAAAWDAGVTRFSALQRTGLEEVRDVLRQWLDAGELTGGQEKAPGT